MALADTAGATLAIIIFLEVAGRFVKAVEVPDVVDDVVPIEEIDQRRIDVAASRR